MSSVQNPLLDGGNSKIFYVHPCEMIQFDEYFLKWVETTYWMIMFKVIFYGLYHGKSPLITIWEDIFYFFQAS